MQRTASAQRAGQSESRGAHRGRLSTTTEKKENARRPSNAGMREGPATARDEDKKNKQGQAGFGEESAAVVADVITGRPGAGDAEQRGQASGMAAARQQNAHREGRADPEGPRPRGERCGKE